VAKLLDGKAIVVSPKPNGEDSGNVLRNLDQWVLKEKPDVVHINSGLHDLKLKDRNYQVPLVEYETNLKTILERIQKETNAKVIFATTTPILDNLHAQRKAGFDRFDADVQKYNIAAVSVMKQAGIPINDLHKLVKGSGYEKLLGGDGTHYTPEGYEMLAAAVTDSILRSLAVGSITLSAQEESVVAWGSVRAAHSCGANPTCPVNFAARRLAKAGTFVWITNAPTATVTAVDTPTTVGVKPRPGTRTASSDMNAAISPTYDQDINIPCTAIQSVTLWRSSRGT